MKARLLTTTFWLAAMLQWNGFGAVDLLIKGARVVDGSGAPARSEEIAISDGKIVWMGRVNPPNAKRVIEAKGLVAAPGFIDVHTHADELPEQPKAENFLRMGVTTVVVGNCGRSELDLDRFFEQCAKAKISVNVASLIGHNSVRQRAMGGSFDREPTPEELAKMKELVGKAMDDGAVGISTGLIYLPGTFAKTEEIIELARVVSAKGGIYVSHMRDEAREIVQALEELFRIGREAKLPVHISHLKLSGRSAWGQAEQILELIEKQRSEGLDVTQDQYGYTASSTGIAQLVPEWAREGGKFSERIGNPDTKAKIIGEMKERLQVRGEKDYAYAVIASFEDKSLNGLNIPQAALKLHGKEDLETQIETILEIVGKGGASGVFHGMSEDDLRTFLGHPNTMVACDSGLRVFGEGVPHPRGYGNNARILGRYVREEKILRLEEAVRKMSSLPARTFGLKNRGQIAEGFAADLVLFDAKKILDKATFSQPHQYPEGIAYVLVNGTVAVENGEFRGGTGEVLRRSR